MFPRSSWEKQLIPVERINIRRKRLEKYERRKIRKFFLSSAPAKACNLIAPGPVSIATVSGKDKGVFILIHIQVECNLNYFHNRVNGLLVEDSGK